MVLEKFGVTVMDLIKFESFTCIRYCLLANLAKGDFLDQLGYSKYLIVFNNFKTYELAIWIPNEGLNFVDDDLFEQGFKKLPISEEGSFNADQLQLILYSAYSKDEISDIEDVLPGAGIKFSYKDEQDKCSSYSGGFAAICSKTGNLNIEIPKDFSGEIFMNSDLINMEDVFGSVDEDDTWVLVAKKR
jgi:hypothetical protein